MEVIRLKGLVSIKDKPQQVIVQGIHELYDLEESLVCWKDDAERRNQLVFIGKNLDKEVLKELFLTAVAETEEQRTAPGKDQVCPSHQKPFLTKRTDKKNKDQFPTGCISILNSFITSVRSQECTL